MVELLVLLLIGIVLFSIAWGIFWGIVDFIFLFIDPIWDNIISRFKPKKEKKPTRSLDGEIERLRNMP